MTQTPLPSLTTAIANPGELVDALAALVSTYALPSLYLILSTTLPEASGSEAERAQRIMTFAGETGATLTETVDELSARLEIGRWPAVANLTLSTKIKAPEVARRYVDVAPERHAEGGHDQ